MNASRYIADKNLLYTKLSGADAVLSRRKIATTLFKGLIFDFLSTQIYPNAAERINAHEGKSKSVKLS